ncbi:PBSX family phage terminase large subunit [Bacillus cereus]|uniref:PBSX family phage terminase, large subunit n=1 Tax=Bacillus cereus VD184 TaxID=1053242 RepID=A0A9W5RBA5_BACCE|nr:PBSX family phage terminase large subunit [Bacillus cereus]EOQ18648.1 PBSX family phage terminase, large subunit [Bacillus cereus VD184]
MKMNKAPVNVQPHINFREVIGKGYNRFWHSKNFYRVCKGSRGSKKSKTTVINLTKRLMQYPWANILVVRRFSNTLKQSCYTDFKWAVYRLKVKSLFKFNESMPEITYTPTGQKILFRGLDDPLKITSITVDVGILCWAWFEEAYEIEDQHKFETVVESIRGKYDSPDFFKQITVTFNPWSENHWLKSYFFDEDTQAYDTFAITTTYKCNEWLDEQDRARYESLYTKNPRRAKIVCDGEWGVADGLVYEKFKQKDFDIEEIRGRANIKSAFGLDYGYTNDPTALCCSLVDLENQIIYIFDEHYENGMSNKRIASVLEKKGYTKERIIADCANPKDNDELRSLGIKGIRGSRKGKDSIMNGVQFIQDFQIFIHPKCENFYKEINNYIFDTDKKTSKRLNRPVDNFNHLMDALRYSLEPYIKKGGKLKSFHKSLLGL